MVEKERIAIGKNGEIKRESKEFKPPKEIANWLERVEKGDIYLAKPVIDDQTGQILVTSASAKKPKIVLPLDKEELAWGLKQKVSESITWLSEWCLRIIRMYPDNVRLKN